MSDESVANGAGSGVLKRSSGFVGGRCMSVCGLWRAHDSGETDNQFYRGNFTLGDPLCAGCAQARRQETQG